MQWFCYSELYVLIVFSLLLTMSPMFDDNEQNHGHRVRVNPAETAGDGHVTDRAANKDKTDVRFLMKNTMTTLSFMGMMF